MKTKQETGKKKKAQVNHTTVKSFQPSDILIFLHHWRVHILGVLHILGLLLKFLVIEHCIAWQTFSLLRMKGVVVQIDLVWPSAWLKDHHRFYFSLLLHKPLKEHKFRGERFALLGWVSFKGEGLPCFSTTQGKALLYEPEIHFISPKPALMSFLFYTHPSCLQWVMLQKLFRLIWVVHLHLLRGCEW